MANLYTYFTDWKRDGTIPLIHEALKKELRKKYGRNEEPSARIIDSQSVKTNRKRGLKGYDARQRIKGRKRHILVDTFGLLRGIVVHSSNIHDRDGAKPLLDKIKGKITGLQLI